MKKLYHISHPENHQSIASNGLLSNEDGEIFLFNAWKIAPANNHAATVLIADVIAYNQLGLEEYIIVEIDPKGIKSKLIPDNVGEATAKFQFIANQNKIHKEYSKIIGLRQIELEKIIQFQFSLYRSKMQVIRV